MDKALYAPVRKFLNFTTRIYFEQIRVRGRKNLPEKGIPCIFAGNHASGLLDPLVIMAALPDRTMSSIAKRSLFETPLVGFFLRVMQAVPVEKKFEEKSTFSSDSKASAEEQTPAQSASEMNKKMFGEVTKRLASGINIVIFPEGTCHSLPQLKDLKSGTARLAFMAKESNVCIVPMGLTYTEPSGYRFRSSVLLDIGKPIYISDELHKQYEAEQGKWESVKGHSAVDVVMQSLETHLREVTVHVPDWEEELLQYCHTMGLDPPKISYVEGTRANTVICSCVVGGKAFATNVITESPQETYSRMKAPAGEVPSHLKMQASRAAFLGLMQSPQMTDEEFIEVIHLCRRVYKPDKIVLPLELYAQLTRNLINGFLRSPALADPEFRKMLRDVLDYSRKLKAFHINDSYVCNHSVNSDPFRERLRKLRKVAVKSLLTSLAVVPLSFVGHIVHSPVAFLSWWGGKKFGVTSYGDRSVEATAKLIIGFVSLCTLYPTGAALAYYYTQSAYSIPLTLSLFSASGIAATRHSPRAFVRSFAADIRLLTKDNNVDELRIMRAQLRDDVRKLTDRHCPDRFKGWWANAEAEVERYYAIKAEKKAQLKEEEEKALRREEEEKALLKEEEEKALLREEEEEEKALLREEEEEEKVLLIEEETFRKEEEEKVK